MESRTSPTARRDDLDSILFASVDGSKSSDLAPLSPFMHHLWERHRHMFPLSFSLADPCHRTQFIYWCIEALGPVRSPYQFLLSDDLIEWLNMPVLDLTTEIGTRPAINGER